MIRIPVILVLLTLFACNNEKNGQLEKADNGGDAVYSVKDDDKAMNDAIAQSVATYDGFLDTLKKAGSENSDFSVKMKFVYDEEGSGEHMWLHELHFRNDKLLGLLNSDPMEVNNVEFGDTIEVKKQDVSDWMYIRNNKLVGGYTIKVLYNKMSKAEQKDFREQVGFDIE